MKIDLIVGARPNFVKAAAILHEAKDYPAELQFRLIHTGQHHDIMSDPYFQDLRLPKPDEVVDLRDFETSIDRFSQMIKRLRDIFNDDWPDAVMVVGDTDSTLAGALAAAKSSIPVLHVEAGLRSFNGIQEDVNRILVDSISLKHYTTSNYADENLKREGHKGIHVGNVMVDTLMRFLPEAREEFPRSLQKPFALFTMHRAENVDDQKRRFAILEAVNTVSDLVCPVTWPVHPRNAYWPGMGNNITQTPPMGYLQFISALESAKFVITDSGGVQEEASVLGVPCFTMRDCTERPETVFEGTNNLTTPHTLLDQVQTTIKQYPSHFRPTYRMGSAAKRIMEDLCATSF